MSLHRLTEVIRILETSASEPEARARMAELRRRERLEHFQDAMIGLVVAVAVALVSYVAFG